MHWGHIQSTTRYFAIVIVASATAGQCSTVSNGQAVLSLVQRFTQAQQNFDQASLSSLADTDYVEVSPKGDEYSRGRMLDFYSSKRRPQMVPEMSITETEVRILNDVAIEHATIRYTINARKVALRGIFVARREPSGWKLISVQYTEMSRSGSLG